MSCWAWPSSRVSLFLHLCGGRHGTASSWGYGGNGSCQVLPWFQNIQQYSVNLKVEHNCLSSNCLETIGRARWARGRPLRWVTTKVSSSPYRRDRNDSWDGGRLGCNKSSLSIICLMRVDWLGGACSVFVFLVRVVRKISLGTSAWNGYGWFLRELGSGGEAALSNVTWVPEY